MIITWPEAVFYLICAIILIWITKLQIDGKL